ncbi:MAG: NADH-quinone oxidoreductase subunit A [Bdellovibrionales bacterium]|nr:NADH-quinone oxidoreductase subunit A [Bdellovibrionales bacterium]
MNQLLPVAFLILFVIIFGVGLMYLASLFGAKGSKSKSHLEAYECGVQATEAKTSKVSIKFYLTAILFILFDIEIIFMYPWALSLNDFIASGSGVYMLGAMGFFLFIFIFGLYWEVKSRALEWE